jgi:hypothetical protein
MPAPTIKVPLFYSYNSPDPGNPVRGKRQHVRIILVVLPAPAGLPVLASCGRKMILPMKGGSSSHWTANLECEMEERRIITTPTGVWRCSRCVFPLAPDRGQKVAIHGFADGDGGCLFSPCPISRLRRAWWRHRVLTNPPPSSRRNPCGDLARSACRWRERQTG